jgi:hypothetical protein
MDHEKHHLRDEVAELSKAVRDLREQIAKGDEHHCHGCGHCAHPVWIWPNPSPTYPWTWHQPVTITCGSTTTAPNLSSGSTAVPNFDTYTSATYVTNTASTNALGAITCL